MFILTSTHTYRAHVEVRGQLSRISYLLLPLPLPRGLSLDHQVCMANEAITPAPQSILGYLRSVVS